MLNVYVVYLKRGATSYSDESPGIARVKKQHVTKCIELRNELIASSAQVMKPAVNAHRKGIVASCALTRVLSSPHSNPPPVSHAQRAITSGLSWKCS